jgi:hypothetical protein
MSNVDFPGERDVSPLVTPEMVEAGIEEFRKWEQRFTHPDEAYPFYDSELGEAVTAVFLGMLEKAHSSA